MRYKPFIQKNLSTLQPLSAITFKTLGKVLGENRARAIKQKIKIAFKATPVLAASSTVERIIFEKIKNEVNTVFDVGIQNELSFYKIRSDCTYHLFEPNQKFLKLIKKQISGFKDHKIKLNEFGLSDEKQDNCVYYEESESFMVNPTYKNGDTDTGMRYSLRKLDDYVTENKIQKIDFLKIDTEGFDYKVILGGLQTIKKDNVSYIQFEYWDGVKKFVDVLNSNFDLYLMWEPRLMDFIEKNIKPLMSPAQQKINYKKSLIPLTTDMIDLIDNKIIPRGAGGNIFGINKKISSSNREKLMFDIDESVSS